MPPEIPAPPPGPGLPQEPSADHASGPPAARSRPGRPGPGARQVWLPAAAGGLGVLAAAAAAVSYGAQYRLVDAARHLALAAALEAAIPDAAALVFACLGVALALQGRRAARARLLNIASAGASVLMNVLAAAPGWRNLAVWAMPPAAYALASDTLIGVIRTSALDRRRHGGGPGRAGELTLLAAAGWLGLWLLRLTLAPRSTAAGFRSWVVEECPVAPGRRAAPGRPGDDPPDDRTPANRPADGTAARPRRRPGSTRDGGTKTARFLALVTEQHGPLAAIPLASVARISAAAAPRAGLHPGSARTALRRAVLAAQQQEETTQHSPEGDR